MQPTLLILAAGMASRYGSMKQIEGFGPDGETIMDYSIYDAIQAGFGKVVFIIRKDFAENFKANFEAKLKGKIDFYAPANAETIDLVKKGNGQCAQIYMPSNVYQYLMRAENCHKN